MAGQFRRDVWGRPELPSGYTQLPAVERRDILQKYLKEANEAVESDIIKGMVGEIVSRQQALNAESQYYWAKNKENGLWLINEDD